MNAGAEHYRFFWPAVFFLTDGQANDPWKDARVLRVDAAGDHLGAERARRAFDDPPVEDQRH